MGDTTNTKLDNMELISQAVELSDDPIKDNTHEVHFENGVFYATSAHDGTVRRFKLVKTIRQMSERERESVHHYNTGEWYGTISLRDVFVHAVHIEEIECLNGFIKRYEQWKEAHMDYMRWALDQPTMANDAWLVKQATEFKRRGLDKFFNRY
jgi:hypothetical protein